MEKTCKNKKCQRILPEGYKHKYCENCRNEQAQKAKNFGKGFLGVAGFIGGAIVVAATKGKINPNSRS